MVHGGVGLFCYVRSCGHQRPISSSCLQVSVARPRTEHTPIFIAFVPARADVVAEGRADAAANHNNKDIDVMVQVAG
jgi:hypothetical protein